MRITQQKMSHVRADNTNAVRGKMAERFKAVVLKTIIAFTITSSNLVLSFLSFPFMSIILKPLVSTNYDLKTGGLNQRFLGL